MLKKSKWSKNQRKNSPKKQTKNEAINSKKGRIKIRTKLPKTENLVDVAYQNSTRGFDRKLPLKNRHKKYFCRKNDQAAKLNKNKFFPGRRDDKQFKLKGFKTKFHRTFPFKNRRDKKKPKIVVKSREISSGQMMSRRNRLANPKHKKRKKSFLANQSKQAKQRQDGTAENLELNCRNANKPGVNRHKQSRFPFSETRLGRKYNSTREVVLRSNQVAYFNISFDSGSKFLKYKFHRLPMSFVVYSSSNFKY